MTVSINGKTDVRVRYNGTFYPVVSFTNTLVELKPLRGKNLQVRQGLVTYNGETLDQCTLAYVSDQSHQQPEAEKKRQAASA